MIYLGADATMKQGGTLTMITDSIQQVDCPSTFSQVTLTVVKQADTTYSIAIDLVGPTAAITICQETTVELLDIKDDGGKGIKNLTWSLSS